MAEHLLVNFGTVRQRARCRHEVAVKPGIELTPLVSWCLNPERPGAFWVQARRVFVFSDVDLAFEFKMRWG